MLKLSSTDSSTKPPKGFEIIGKKYSIEYPAIISPELAGLDEDNYLFGLSLNVEKKILVREDLDSIEKADTLVHETFHALDFIFDLELEERQVKVLATTFVALLAANPEYREFLNEIISKQA